MVELFFDAQQLIIFGDAVSAAHRAGLDLSGTGCYDDIGNRCVLRLTGAMGDNRRETGFLSHSDGIKCLRQRTDLVEFY